jgi:hypothetical protein
LCFQCYRADLERQRQLKAAGQLNTSSEERFQTILPLEPIDRRRLQMLKAERAQASAASTSHAGQFTDRRRHAQMAARRALQATDASLRVRYLAGADRDRATQSAIHALELQLPESWLPFVISR